MPQITAIESQKRKSNRYNVFLDGKFTFSIDEHALIQNGLKVGDKLSENQVEKIIKEIILSKLIDRSLKFLTFRPRSEKEVTDYLTKKISQKENIKFSQAKESPLIAKVIAKLKKYQYLDDLKFARWWVSARSKNKPKGFFLIKLELIKKGIKREIIDSVLQEFPSQDLALKALEKKFKKWHKLKEPEKKQKAFSYLASRGFDFETIKEAFAFLTKRR